MNILKSILNAIVEAHWFHIWKDGKCLCGSGKRQEGDAR
jgi:hypothetical protein